jgi:hypothetical protein
MNKCATLTLKSINMNSYDAWKDGRFDSTSPINRIEVETSPLWANLTEAYESGHIEVFTNLQAEIINELDIIYQVLKASDHGMKKRVLSLIDKVK